MVLTPSVMQKLGTPAPEFNLENVVSGAKMSLDGVRGGKGLLVIFLCKHCPYVKHIESEIAKLAHDYEKSGIHMVGISSNDVENYAEDSPAELKKMAHALGYTFPILFDETQEVAKSYHAACTPDFFLYDADLKLYYRGQFDESRPGNDDPVTGDDIRKAFDSLIEGKPFEGEQYPSVGCNIKWKPGNEPSYGV